MKRIRPKPRAFFLFIVGASLIFIIPDEVSGSDALLYLGMISLSFGMASLLLAVFLARNFASIIPKETSPLELSEVHTRAKEASINLFAMFFAALLVNLFLMVSHILYAHYDVGLPARICLAAALGFTAIVGCCSTFFLPKMFFQSVEEINKSKRDKIKRLWHEQ